MAIFIYPPDSQVHPSVGRSDKFAAPSDTGRQGSWFIITQNTCSFKKNYVVIMSIHDSVFSV